MYENCAEIECRGGSRRSPWILHVNRCTDRRERREYLHLFLARVVVRNHEVELVGHTGLLARFYAEDDRQAALDHGALKRTARAVQREVRDGAPFQDRNLFSAVSIGRLSAAPRLMWGRARSWACPDSLRNSILSYYVILFDGLSLPAG